MRKSLFAVAAASLILLGSAAAGATVDTSGDSNFNGNINTRDNSNAALSDNDSAAAARASLAAGEGGSANERGDDDEAPASGAAGVYVTTSDDTCMGSSSVGGQSDSFGFSVGSTWTDANCIALKNARELKAQGHHKAAKARLCMEEDSAMAFELAGEPCPRMLPSTQAALTKIRTVDSEFAAAAGPGAQLALIGDARGGAPADAPGGTADAGFLLAMAQSVVQQIAAVLPTPDPASDLSDPYPYDGIE